MELTKVKDYIKTGWKWIIRAYLAAFLATTLHVGYDFCTSNLPRIERGETTQYLQLRKYRVNIGEEEKYLTLVGEIHWYTREENELAKKLVDEHEYFAAETGEGMDMSVGNVLYAVGLSIPVTVNGTFDRLGSGRWYDSIHEIAEEKGHKVNALEKDPLIHMSLREKAELFGRSYLGMLWAPLSYYEGKNEEPYSASKFADFRYIKSLIGERDKVMAGNLANLLRQDGVDNLLAEVGGAHLEGVIRNLSEEVELKEVK